MTVLSSREQAPRESCQRSRSPSPILIANYRNREEDFAEKKELDIHFRAYPNIPYAAGLGLGAPRYDSRWQPSWEVFPLKAFRGSNYTYLKIQHQWDDADLLRELRKTYDKLRTWRKWLSLRNVSSITMVLADHSFVYPQRVGPARVSPSKNMRLRYLLQHPRSMSNRYEFMQVLTARTDLGIEFVERFQLSRIAFAVLFPILISTLLGVVYAALTGDVSSAFTISGKFVIRYMTSAYSVCLVLVGVLNLVES
ncbi:hypothetical protein BC835DRAFT_1262366 [Cytidiella melzeri]|nr:hypothetical protein BC835DRAFT_1262366 [Cytidiella melzeri]